MPEKMRFWKDMLSEIGRGCMSMGGFLIDGQGSLIEEYAEDDEDWPEEIYCGDESQDGEDFGWSNCIWNYSECDRT